MGTFIERLLAPALSLGTVLELSGQRHGTVPQYETEAPVAAEDCGWLPWGSTGEEARVPSRGESPPSRAAPMLALLDIPSRWQRRSVPGVLVHHVQPEPDGRAPRTTRQRWTTSLTLSVTGPSQRANL